MRSRPRQPSLKRAPKRQQPLTTEVKLAGDGDRVAIRRRGDIWVFDLALDTPKVSAEQVKLLLDDAL